MRKKSRSRRHGKTKPNQPTTISSTEVDRSHEPNTISSPEGVMDSGAVSDADEIDKGSYTPLSFYMDSALNHPGPVRKGYGRVLRSSQSEMNESIGKNYIPLSSYTTNLVYHPDESTMDIFLDPFTESKLDIFVPPVGESTMDVFVNSIGDDSDFDSIMGIPLDPYMDIFRPLSYYMDPTYSFTGHKNYIPLSTLDNQSSSSQSKVRRNSIPEEIASSSKSKVIRNSIPDKVALSILSKLSVKSLKRFGCVCKSWSILFENINFINMYSNHFLSRHGSDDHYHTFILENQFDYENCCYYQSEFHLPENGLKLDLPSPLQQSGDDTCILGSTSVNGIFCLGQSDFNRQKEFQSQYVLWNPLTGEFMVIPSSPTELTPIHPSGLAVSREPLFHGFGYDQLRDDFKVIQYVSFVSDLYARHTTSFFEIYSLKSNSWRMINMQNHLSHWGYVHSDPFSGREVYVDGACHWLVSEPINHQHAMTLLSFDLSDEVFLTTPIGEEPYSPYTCYRRLTVLNGSIALISNYHDDIVFHISILGELGVTESWIKLYTYGSFPSIQWRPIGFGKMGCIYTFTKKDYELAYVDLITQIIEEVGITGAKSSKIFCGLYKESLLSIRGSS